VTHHQKNYTGRSISLPEETDKELIEAAQNDGVTVSMLVRRWIGWQLRARRLNDVGLNSPNTELEND
jgi:hypothetical protein